MATYDTKTEDGLKKFRARGAFLIKKGEVVELTIAKEDATDPMRKYLHAIMQIVAKDRGIAFPKFKEAIIIHLGYYQDIMGVKVRQHTTEMSKKEYSRLIDDYYRWTIDEGYLIPTSDEYLAGVLE